jgi:hypothetical protein
LFLNLNFCQFDRREFDRYLRHLGRKI